jgi:hypothetical protein
VALLIWLEQTALGAAVRDVLWVYPALLALHVAGLAVALGFSVAIDLRLLGAAHALPLGPLREFYPLIYAGLWLTGLSGVALLAGDAATTGADPVFHVKLIGIALAAIPLRLIETRILGGAPAATGGHAATSARLLAAASLILWAGALVAGRLVGYGFFR